MDTQQATSLLASARSEQAGKPLAPHTRLFKRGPESFAVRFHETDVVSFGPQGFRLDSGGWRTLTTKARIAEFSPARIYQKSGNWFVATKDGAVPFFDGITVDATGNVTNAPAQAKQAALANKTKRVDKAVSAYLQAWLDKANGDKALDAPSNGDCWYCRLFDREGERTDHLIQHVREKYFVPSLLVHAMRERHGETSLPVVWHMAQRDAEAGKLGKDSFFWLSLRAYFRKRRQKLIESW